jgi:hypothetical protein
MEIKTPDGGFLPVQCNFSYVASDPFAVTLTFFDHPGGVTVVWEFGRDLLHLGMYGRVGDGDVRIWPSSNLPLGDISISLTSPDGVAVLETEVEAIKAFMDEVETIVPIGFASYAMNIDADIERLLS